MIDCAQIPRDLAAPAGNTGGGAAAYFGTALLGFVVTVATLGLCYPFALVLRERWRAKHSYIEGRRLVFNGSAWGLFGLWWKWEHTSWAQQLPGTFAVAVR